MTDEPTGRPELRRFARVLHQAIKNRGVNNAQLGAHLGVSRAAVARWTKATASPPVHRVPEIERFLHLPEGQLVATLLYPTEGAEPPEFSAAADKGHSVEELLAYRDDVERRLNEALRREQS